MSPIPTRPLGETGISTTVLGYGCAGLYKVPDSRSRRRLLDVAYDAGIRHFDVAPMYGMGIAETELRQFLRGRRDSVTIATKVGIDVRFFVRAAGHFQRPGRAFLSRFPDMSAKLRSSAPGPSHSLGSLFYKRTLQDGKTLTDLLERSLRRLGTEYVDLLLLHDPDTTAPSLSYASHYIEGQADAGRVRSWGFSLRPENWQLPEPQSASTLVIQYERSIFSPVPLWATSSAAQITFGAVRRGLPILLSYFQRHPTAYQQWTDFLGTSPTAAELSNILLNWALGSNASGIVLFSSTNPTHILSAAAATTLRHGPSQRRAIAYLTNLIQGVARSELPLLT